MACNCGNRAANGYIVTKPNGSTQKVATEVEAKAMATRVGGTYTKA